jgi:tetratricopeptide (TPR) repeat protein
MLLIVLAILLQAPSATPADTLFALGNRLYAEGDFRGAAAAYEGAAETGWTSPALEHGLGAAYLEAGEVGRAVLHFERAHRLAPRDADVAHNLRLARARVDFAAPPLPPGEAAARWLSARVGAGALAVVLFLLYLAVLGLIGVRLWTGTPRPWLRRALLVLIPLGLFAAVAAVGTARYEAQPRAVVVASDAAVRAAPSAASGTTSTLPEGAVLPVTDERSGWRAVRLPDGSRGWIAASALEEV